MNGQTAPSVTVMGARRYFAELVLEVKNLGQEKPDKHKLWVAWIRDFPPCQRVLERSSEPQDYQLVVDELDNQFTEFEFDEILPGETRLVRL